MSKNSSKLKNLSIPLSCIALLGTVDPAYAVCNPTLIGMTVLSSTLDFASALPCVGTAGTIVVSDSTGARTTGGCISQVFGTVGRARIRVTGGQAAPSDKVKVSLLASVASITANTTTTMTVNLIKFNPQNGPPTTFNGNITKTFDIGATLNVGAGQTGGDYSGTFTINAVCK